MTTKIKFDPDHKGWGIVRNGVWKAICPVCGDDCDIDCVGESFCWNKHSKLQALRFKIKLFFENLK